MKWFGNRTCTFILYFRALEYLWFLVAMLTNLTSQNVSVNMPNDVSFARTATGPRIRVLVFVKFVGICYISWASIGHPRTPTHITSRNVARAGRKQLRRLLKNSKKSQNAFFQNYIYQPLIPNDNLHRLWAQMHQKVASFQRARSGISRLHKLISKRDKVSGKSSGTWEGFLFSSLADIPLCIVLTSASFFMLVIPFWVNGKGPLYFSTIMII